jgi:hypothetical protein
MLSATHEPFSLTSTWEERAVTLFRSGEMEATFKLYRHHHGAEWSRWHLVTTGRYFATPDDACAYLVREWDREQTTAERWAEQRAAAVYAEAYAYACGYQD